MTDPRFDEAASRIAASELTRRRLMLRSGALALSAAMAMRLAAEHVAAEEGTAVAVDPAQVQQLIDLSRTLCGGGNFSSDRATSLMRLIAADPDLSAGFDELIATPPTEGQPLGSERAQGTAEVILTYWYAGIYDGQPVPDRSTAYYQLIAWQAMYTFPWAVCKAFGGWADAPPTSPIVAGNAPASASSN